MRTDHLEDAENTATRLNVLVVYENVRCGKLAKELCDRLADTLGADYKLDLRLWKMAAMQSRYFANEALADSVSAALIIVATDAAKPLPPAIRSCLSRCASRSRGALVVQLHGTINMEKVFSSTYNSLKEVAESSGVTFFSQAIPFTEDEFDYSMEAIHQRAKMSSHVLEDILQPR